MKKTHFAILTSIVIAIVAYLLYEKVQLLWQKSRVKTDSVQQLAESSLVSPHFSLPDKPDFCGEPVPIDEIDVRERFDKELLINSYLHASTILILKKAYRWFPQIEPILKEEGIPDDFKYLAVIESSLDNAISPAGASGFWQLMKETAIELGLVVNDEVDERFHPIKSTRAACKYLKKSYQKFGNWTLVAAAYNRGNGGIEQAMTTQKANSYYDLLLNDQTNRFVFRILALKEIMENPKKYRFEIQEKDRYVPEKLEDVRIDTTVSDLVAFAISKGVTYKTLKNYNEWILTDKLSVKDTTKWVLALPIK
ncbi:MAG: lytic transglycosylase domain-containing protein [Cytophagales bacterium]|nr:MAG: lytic transglycosylase domain-containing protein [Cytophagales bacterium]